MILASVHGVESGLKTAPSMALDADLRQASCVLHCDEQRMPVSDSTFMAQHLQQPRRMERTQSASINYTT